MTASYTFDDVGNRLTSTRGEPASRRPHGASAATPASLGAPQSMTSLSIVNAAIIIPALIVSVAGKTYAIPLNNVLETLAIPPIWDPKAVRAGVR